MEQIRVCVWCASLVFLVAHVRIMMQLTLVDVGG